jgi:hypothetical protein
MHVKGFLIEDNQGREFVVVCEPPYISSPRKFALRGWQRRRLVPLEYSEQERRQIVAEVLLTLNDLFTSLPRFTGDIDADFADLTASADHAGGGEEGRHGMN